MPPPHPNPDNDARLTRVETEIESLALNMDRLTGAVNQQSTQIQQLAIAVTSANNAANSPRETNWSVLLTACSLILAIGAAVLSPLFSRISETQKSVQEARTESRDHGKDLASKFAREAELLSASTTQSISSLRKEFEDVRINGAPATQIRLMALETLVQQLETSRLDQTRREQEELQQLKNK